MKGSVARAQKWPALAALALLVAAAGPVRAGDGSGTDNPTLLRGTFGLDCTDATACPGQSLFTQQTQPAASTVSEPVATSAKPASTSVATTPATVPPPTAAPDAAATTQPVLDPVMTGAVPGEATPGDDALTGDWQIALKGSSTWDGRGQRYRVILSPSGSLTFNQMRGQTRLKAGVDLAWTPGGSVDIDGGNGAIEVDHALQSDLTLRAALTLDGTRDTINAVTSSANEEIGALSLLGSADTEIEKQFGRASLTLGGTLSRRLVGDTVLTGGALSSNADRNWTGFGLRARAGYRITPILSAYVEANADRAYYDAAATGTGAREDNWTYRAVLGLTGAWSNGMTASLYGGYGLTEYDSALLTSGSGYVVGGNLSMPFARGGALTASLDTSLTPTDSIAGASTKVSYAATLGARYLVNDWLTLRSGLGGTWTLYPGVSDTEYGLTANAGFDWLFGPHTTLTADYDFGADWTPTASGVSHTVSLGMLVHR